MAANRRVPLAALKYVNFHSDAYTIARRTDPIPQQTCIGDACTRHQPHSILCTNMGSDGAGGFQWKCEADLPSGIRFGKVDISCEGWERPGDTNILHGSCGLEYQLIRIDGGLERDDDPFVPRKSNGLFDKAFNLLFFAISGIILYSLLRNVIRSIYPRWTPPPLFGAGPGPGGGGGGGPGGWGPGGGGGGDDHDTSPPPPYTKSPSPSSVPLPQARRQGWGPGFWTGLAAGGAGAYLANRARAPTQQRPPTQTYGQGVAGPGPSTSAQQQRNRAGGGLWGDLGGRSGSSGEMRRATGFGGTSVR